MAHPKTSTLSDQFAVRFQRSAMDLATGYRHPDECNDNGTGGANPTTRSTLA